MKFNSLSITLFWLLLSFAYSFAGDFVDNGDQTITDKNTNLMWQQNEGGQMVWESGIMYCEELTLAEYDDWRLPNIKELESINDDKLRDPRVDKYYFPNADNILYWSSTTDPILISYAWAVDFGRGVVGYRPKEFDRTGVRCVRSIQ